MTLRKKVYTVVLTAAMVLSIGFSTAIPTFANNYHDTDYVFNFPMGTNVAYTGIRSKSDDSSAYMKLKEIGPRTYNPAYTASVVNLYGKNFSRTWYYVFDSSDINRGRYLSNYAWEDNHRVVSVQIKAVRRAAHGYYASGVWSPDSI
ncbi:hypothetical protein EV207_10738 [Scopulibacillus darangshiensis]|uniref:Uncharacterized protein n=1 Tax=Scopulibacillus darangshiensis TaxID=442528 RepID=A0A4R2P703_9BACL|nr:hypothetical protein [Scopulibacillus darangshiensis]TCP29944.1 hypothetical protein EV207_10738 [Scopulibacillus darangshiensis]